MNKGRKRGRSKKIKIPDYVSTITGYKRTYYKFGKGMVTVTLPLIITTEYWSIWYKGNHIKLKKTKLRPRQTIDNYGWECRQLIEVLSFVELDNLKIEYLK